MNANKVTPENLVAAVNFEILTIINGHSASRNAAESRPFETGLAK